jgi:hypothetical protein
MVHRMQASRPVRKLLRLTAYDRCDDDCVS